MQIDELVKKIEAAAEDMKRLDPKLAELFLMQKDAALALAKQRDDALLQLGTYEDLVAQIDRAFGASCPLCMMESNSKHGSECPIGKAVRIALGCHDTKESSYKECRYVSCKQMDGHRGPCDGTP